MSKALATLTLILALIATSPESRASDPTLYKKWHDVCLSGDAGEIDAQIKNYEARIAKDPQDQLAKAYLGSACALRAKESFWGPSKLKYLKRGKSLLDSAVASAPEDPRVRMIRAIACYQVPERFKTRPTSIKDFQILVPIAKKPSSSLTVNERQAILYYAHLAYRDEKMESAGELKKLCHQLDPNSHYGKRTK